MTFEMRKTPEAAKKFAVLLAIAFAFICFATFAGASKCYAEQKVYQQFDNIYCMGGASVTAVVNDDGVSGYIEFRDTADDSIYSEDRPLTSIGGTPLKDIIKFKNGGYVESFWLDDGPLIMHPCWFAGYSDRLKYYVKAAGPKGWGSGSGYLKFYDWWGDYKEREDSFELKIWSSSLKTHEVTEYYACWAPSFDPKPTCKRIEWHSES